MLIGAALLWAGHGFAQTSKEKPHIQKGTGVVSLDVPFGTELSMYTNPSDPKTANLQSFAFKPSVSGSGFVARNFMLGAGFGVVKGWSRSKVGSQPTEHYATPTFILPALVMRYYTLFTDKVGFYTQLSGETLLQVDGAFKEQMAVSAVLAPRLIFFPKPNWGIEAGFGEVGYRYTQNYPMGNTNSTQHIHDFVTDPTLSIGFSYFIRKQKS